MNIKNVSAKILLVLALPFVFLGLIDPLEGGLALIFATAIYAVAFFLLKAVPSRWLWVPFLLTLLIGGSAVLWAIFGRGTEQMGPLPPLVIFLLWAYRAAVIAALGGAIYTAYIHILKKPN